jgi:hypothetical protein
MNARNLLTSDLVTHTVLLNATSVCRQRRNNVSDSPLQVLRNAGIDRLPEAQRAVFENLNPEELEVAVSIQKRQNAVAPDVEGQGDTYNTVC